MQNGGLRGHGIGRSFDPAGDVSRDRRGKAPTFLRWEEEPTSYRYSTCTQVRNSTASFPSSNRSDPFSFASWPGSYVLTLQGRCPSCSTRILGVLEPRDVSARRARGIVRVRPVNFRVARMDERRYKDQSHGSKVARLLLFFGERPQAAGGPS
jgi:hypothetical protein